MNNTRRKNLKKRSNSDPSLGLARRRGGGFGGPGLRRRNSFGNHLEVVQIKSCLRVVTLEESLSKETIKFIQKSQQSETKPQVKFGIVNLREYERMISDNPSCSNGPPIGIGWRYGRTLSMPVVRYEHFRPPRRKGDELILGRPEREKLLEHVPQTEKAYAIRHSLKAKNQRRRTVHNLPKEKMDQVLESARRKILRTIRFEKRTSKQVEGMMERANKAAEAIDQIRKETDELVELMDPEELEMVSPHRFLNLHDSSDVRYNYVANQE